MQCRDYNSVFYLVLSIYKRTILHEFSFFPAIMLNQRQVFGLFEYGFRELKVLLGLIKIVIQNNRKHL